MPPQSITFSRGKTRLLYINSYCYARTSGAAAHGRRFPTSADTPLTVRFTAIASKLFNLFFYKAFPHLIYSLLRVNKLMDNVSERNGVSDNANRDRRHSAAETPLTVRFTAIASKLFNLFFYKVFPHLIYSLLRVNKLMDNVSERNGVSDNANRDRQLAGGVSDNANRDRQLAGGASDNANRDRQLAGAGVGFDIIMCML